MCQRSSYVETLLIKTQENVFKTFFVATNLHRRKFDYKNAMKCTMQELYYSSLEAETFTYCNNTDERD